MYKSVSITFSRGYEDNLNNINNIIYEEFINFKYNYKYQIERYFKLIYSKDISIDSIYNIDIEFYSVDKKLLDWYFNKGQDILNEVENRLLINSINNEQYIQIKNAINGLLKLFRIIWERESKDKLQDIYKLILDTPLILLKRVKQIIVEEKIKSKKVSIDYWQVHEEDRYDVLYYNEVPLIAA